MKNIHKPILDFMFFYAQKLDNENVIAVLEKQAIDNEDEARAIVSFLNIMCELVQKDSMKDVVVLNQVVCTSDAEKVCDVMEDYIEEIGYEHLVE